MTAMPPPNVATDFENELNMWTRRIQGEFREDPGLRLTFSQAVRYFDLDPRLCSAVLTDLVASGFLRRTPTDQFVRSPVH